MAPWAFCDAALFGEGGLGTFAQRRRRAGEQREGAGAPSSAHDDSSNSAIIP